MHQCSTCSFVAKNKAGLSSHVRAHGSQQENTGPEPTIPEMSAMASDGSEDCPHCKLLPSGSVNITSMFIVVIFCLTAVLFTAIYQLNDQQDDIATLRAQLTSYEQAQTQE